MQFTSQCKELSKKNYRQKIKTLSTWSANDRYAEFHLDWHISQSGLIANSKRKVYKTWTSAEYQNINSVNYTTFPGSFLSVCFLFAYCRRNYVSAVFTCTIPCLKTLTITFSTCFNNLTPPSIWSIFFAPNAPNHLNQPLITNVFCCLLNFHYCLA